MSDAAVGTALNVAVIGLGLLLSAVAFQASASYREPRFALVGLAVLVLALIGGFGVLTSLYGSAGSGVTLAPGVAALLIVAELLLLGSLVLPRRTKGAPPRG